MWTQINRAATAACVQVMLFMQCMRQDLQDLKNDERGLSGIVVAVLLILIAVMAAAILWENLSTWMSDMWDMITSGF